MKQMLKKLYGTLQLTLNQNVAKQISLSSHNEIDEEVLLLTQQIQNAAWYSTSTQTAKQAGLRYPNEIISLIAEEKKVKKKVATNPTTIARNFVKQNDSTFKRRNE